MLHMTKRKLRPNGSSVCDYLLLCNYSPSFDSFSELIKENRTFSLELKESLLITRNKPSLSRNIKSAPLYLFERV